VTLVEHAPSGWPFWAPLGDADIVDALALSGLQPGERFIDLGCGDGRVLAAALELGAHVTGYEIDANLAARARERLAWAGDAAQVIEQDFFDADFVADAVFAYLSPTVLQRLSPQLKLLSAPTRIITAWFDVPGLGPPACRRGNVRCYRASSSQFEPAVVSLAAGWSSPGLLCALPPATRMLVTTSLNHPRGPVVINVDEALCNLVAIATGIDVVTDHVSPVAIDLVVGPCPKGGSFVTGTLEAPAAGNCEFFCFTPATGQSGFWPIDGPACVRLRHQFAIGDRVRAAILENGERYCD
jgi:SAM-dependent methyltransferase